MASACKDCYPDGHGIKSSMVPARPRPAPHPGPRCATHHRAAVKARKAAAHESRAQKVYGLPPGQYDRLYAFQGGRCALCRRATGATKKLAIDHDHACCPGPSSCGACVRGLCCSVCNRLLGHGRDDPEFFLRFVDYLTCPPAAELCAQDALAAIQQKRNQQ